MTKQTLEERKQNKLKEIRRLKDEIGEIEVLINEQDKKYQLSEFNYFFNSIIKFSATIKEYVKLDDFVQFKHLFFESGFKDIYKDDITDLIIYILEDLSAFEYKFDTNEDAITYLLTHDKNFNVGVQRMLDCDMQLADCNPITLANLVKEEFKRDLWYNIELKQLDTFIEKQLKLKKD